MCYYFYMKIKFLGTSGAEGFPALACSCSYCKKAKKLKNKRKKKNSQNVYTESVLQLISVGGKLFAAGS